MASTGVEEPLIPGRLHVSTLCLQLQLQLKLEQELAVLRWADWAGLQISEWGSTRDPDAWDARAVLRGLAEAGRAGARRTAR